MSKQERHPAWDLTPLGYKYCPRCPGNRDYTQVPNLLKPLQEFRSSTEKELTLCRACRHYNGPAGRAERAQLSAEPPTRESFLLVENARLRGLLGVSHQENTVLKSLLERKSAEIDDLKHRLAQSAGAHGPYAPQ